MFREFVGINVFLKPRDHGLYRKFLPKPFVMPEQPLVIICAVDYLKVLPWPMTRCQKWAALLRSKWGNREGWHVLINALNLKTMARARLYGEPTSGKPNHYGEVKSFDLPNSKWKVNYSTKYFRFVDEDLDSL